MMYLNDSEIKALLNQITDTRDKAIISLFLNTGVLLNELIELKVSSINWQSKILRVNSSRPREIPLNDEVFTALTNWSKIRLDCQLDYLFITLRGQPGPMSMRNIDKLIKKYASQAGIERLINAQILRATFAVRFLKKQSSIEHALYILGLTSLKGLNRYLKAAKENNQTLEHLDTRPLVIRQIAKLWPQKPKQARVLKVVAKEGQGDVTIGRDGIIEKIKHDLNQGVSILLAADLGAGKGHILKHIAKENDYIYITSPAPAKDMLAALCQKYCPEWDKQLPKGKRSSSREIAEHISQAVKDVGKPILVIDNLDSLRKSDINLFEILLEQFVILAATEKTSERLKPIWWKFKRIDLEPMSDQAIQALINHLSQDIPIENRELLTTQIQTHASGSPLAVVEMVHQIKQLPRVKEDDIRKLHHEAGVKYIECANLVIVFWAAALIYRFIALGTHSFENYILAGFLTTTALVSRLMLRRMK